MLKRLLNPLRPSRQPFLTRQNYARELLAAAAMPAAGGLTEGAVIGVLAEKLFDVSPWGFATLQAAPFFCNITSFAWAWLARGHAKTPVLTVITTLLVLTVASIALLPTNASGATMLVILAVVARCLIAGTVTLRTTLWRMNYPRQIRAQITSKFVLTSSLVLAVWPTIVYFMLDWHAPAYRVMYPLGAAIGLIGVWSLSRVRIRREREQISFERQTIQREREPWVIRLLPRGNDYPVYTEDEQSQAVNNTASTNDTNDTNRTTWWTVLRDDIPFRNYMIFQFTLGFANMMGLTAAIKLITSATGEQRFGLAVLLTQAIPMIIAMVSISRWAKFFDNSHIAQYRVRHTCVFMASHAVIGFAALTGNLWLFALGMAIQGFGRAGGMLAWALGHNDFAKREHTQIYMNIHVTLTGVRGAIAPFVGMWLLIGWDHAPPTFAQHLFPSFNGIGSHLYMVTLALLLVSELGFIRIARQLKIKP